MAEMKLGVKFILVTLLLQLALTEGKPTSEYDFGDVVFFKTAHNVPGTQCAVTDHFGVFVGNNIKIEGKAEGDDILEINISPAVQQKSCRFAKLGSRTPQSKSTPKFENERQRKDETIQGIGDIIINCPNIYIKDSKNVKNVGNIESHAGNAPAGEEKGNRLLRYLSRLFGCCFGACQAAGGIATAVGVATAAGAAGAAGR
ncbi:uncharacterized protein LOC115813391 [Chanos chanos]|uniref:Uncharacterized protein LOC115813391 n=1 Tax=Chanos chanos TaxID=29144 RepID=A0A6J2VKU7_CHACN|nr:uncharacterized protein LOC115813391 [Chanos chanos]